MESATERRHPLKWIKVKGWCKRPPLDMVTYLDRQTPLGARSNSSMLSAFKSG